MEIKGFDGNLSEESKKALQSETWQKVRDSMKEEKKVKHFTAENTAENAYGAIWNQVVNEYLRSGYNAEDKSPDIVVMGKTYKTLRRPKVTAFYDAAGDTLFDVTNERLEKEYEWLMNGGAGEGPGSTSNVVKGDVEEEPGLPDPKMAESKEADIQNDMAGMLVTEIKREVSLKEDADTNKVDEAKKKYESSLKVCKPHEKRYFEGPIREHMLNRFKEDSGFCEDFLQKHKTFQKCIKYMIKKAKESVPKSEMQAMVEGSVYLEWMEDYFRKDDKAEEEERVKKEAESKAKRGKVAAERKTAKAKVGTNKEEKVSVPHKTEVPKTPPKPKKNGKEMDGQLDLFAMMGM